MEANDTQNISINQIIAQVRHDIEAVNIAGVMKAWDLFRSRFPTEVEGCLTIGFLLREAGKPDEAEMVFSDTMARFPDNVWAAVPHAAIPALRRDWSEAERRWNALIRRFPETPLGYVGKGTTLAHAGEFDEAEAILSTAVVRFPDDFWAGFHHAFLASRRHAWDEAYGRWDRLRGQHPDRVEIYQHMVEVLTNLGRAEEAEALLAHALERFPEHEQTASLRARFSALERVDFTGDLVKRGEAVGLQKAVTLGPAAVYLEAPEQGGWSRMPSRWLHLENEYIELSDVTLYNLFGCYGLVELNDGRIYSEVEYGSFNIHCKIHIARHGDSFYKSSDHASLRGHIPRPLAGTHFLPYRLAGIYYFHFMVETLQYVYEGLRYWPEATVLLPGSERFFERIPQQVYTDAVHALGPRTNSCVWLEEGIFKIQRLIIPRQWLYGNCAYADEILRHLPAQSLPEPRIAYISRSTAGNRRISNEAAVIEAIRDLLPNCEVVRLEEMSFADQVALFRDASILISPHGGGLTNLVFCRPGTAIVEVLPEDSPYMYHDLAHLRSLDYMAYRPPGSVHHSPLYEADLRQFRDAIESFVAKKIHTASRPKMRGAPCR